MGKLLEEFGDLLDGSLIQKFKKCGKRNCACFNDSSKRHGPYWLWSRLINGKTVQKSVNEEEIAFINSAISNYKIMFEEIKRAKSDTEKKLIKHKGKQSNDKRKAFLKYFKVDILYTIYLCKSYLKLIEDNKYIDPIITEAISRQIATGYSKPFTVNRFRSKSMSFGTLDELYEFILNNEMGELLFSTKFSRMENKLHLELIDLRNEVITHKDDREKQYNEPKPRGNSKIKFYDRIIFDKSKCKKILDLSNHINALVSELDGKKEIKPF